MKKKVWKRILSIVLSLTMVLGLAAVDGLNVSAEETTLIVNDSTTGEGLHQFNFQGDWGTSTGYPDRFQGGDEHWYNFQRYTAGQELPSFSIKFQGTGIALYGEKQPVLGIYTVYVDGEEKGEIDAYSASNLQKQKLYEVTGLDYAEHTIRVELSDTKKNAASSSTDGQIDYAEVYGVQGETEPEQPAYTKIEDSVTTAGEELFKFKYSGSWGISTNYPTMFSNGDEHYSNDGGAYFEMRFIGTKAAVYATKANNHGNYDVYIDGEKVGQANATITGERIHQQLIFSSETLDEGEHTLKVQNPADSDKAIQIDYVIISHGEITATELLLSDSEINLECGMSKEVTATVVPEIATVEGIEWSSSDESVAAVKDGVITAVASEKASAVITAKITGTDLTASVTVNVFPAVEYLGAFVGSVDTLDIQEDYEQYLTQFNDSFSDIAWKGDILVSKIVTASREEEVKNAEIIASDFTDEAGNVISADNVEIQWLKNIEANIGRGNSSAPVKEFPDVIYKGGKIDIAPETLQSAWISISIPKDAKAGTYKGTMTVKADGLENPYVFDYEFTVLNLVQPTTEEVGSQIQLWQHPFSVANYYLGLGSQPSGGISYDTAEDFYFTEEHFNLMRESMKEYAAIGGHDVVANIVEEAWGHQSYYNDLSMVKWTKKSDGTFTFDYDWYDKWINFMIETGVLDPENGVGMIKCYSIVPWNNQITYYDEATGNNVSKAYTPGNSDWAEMWTVFLRDFMAHSKEKGWFDITYISMDERSMAQLEPAVELISSIQDENGKSFKISSAFNYNAQSGYEFSDQIHDISINLGNVPNSSEAMRDLAEHRKELGLLTTIYTCTGNYPGNFTISDPAENMWTMWYSLAHGTDGFMRWAYDNYVYDMTGNVTYRYWEPGDGWFIYPESREEAGDLSEDVGFYSTPRYEMLKKGLRDINKAKYLMSLSEELKAEVTALVESIEQPRQGGSYGSAVAASEADRQLTISEANRMRDGILAISAGVIVEEEEEKVTYLSDLDWESDEGGSPADFPDGTAKDTAVNGAEMKLQVNGQVQTFEKGLGTHAPSEIVYDISGKGYERFEAFAGVDLQTLTDHHNNSAEGIIGNFIVKIDDEVMAQSGEMNPAMDAYHFAVEIPEDATTLTLIVETGTHTWSDWADWADAKLIGGDDSIEEVPVEKPTLEPVSGKEITVHVEEGIVKLYRGETLVAESQSFGKVKLDGKTYTDFNVTASEIQEDVETVYGQADRIVLVMYSSKAKLTKTLWLDVLQEFDDAIVTTTFLNAQTEASDVEVTENEFTLSSPDSDRIWSYNGGGEGAQSYYDTLQKVSNSFYRENRQDETAAAIPVADIYSVNGGVLVGDASTYRKFLSTPVKGSNGTAAVSIVWKELSLEAEKETKVGTSVISVHDGDYYNGLRTFADVMEANGFAAQDTVPESSYALRWESWGWEGAWTIDKIVEKLDDLYAQGIRQITLDDCWYTSAGDWELNPQKFPNGTADMKRLTDAVHEKGMTIILWWRPMDGGRDQSFSVLAGFTQQKSKLLEEHPEYFVKNADGSFAKLSGPGASDSFNGSTGYALCPQSEGAVESQKAFIRRAMTEWGIDGFKSDYVWGMPKCYDETHNHGTPEESTETASGIFYEAIYEEMISINPNAFHLLCNCGTPQDYYSLPYVTQIPTADPTSVDQTRRRVKAYKALAGDDFPVTTDHNEIWYPSTVGTGAVLIEKRDFAAGSAQETEYNKWLAIASEHELHKGTHIGDLYAYGIDPYETYVIEKDGMMYYSFYNDGKYKTSGNPDIELKGLDPEKMYRIENYVTGQVLAEEISGAEAVLTVNVNDYLLVRAVEAEPECEHTAVKVVGAAEATCTEAGYTGDTVCEDCGETISAGTVIPAKGHTSVKIVDAKYATCTEAGYTGDKVCEICGETVETGKAIEALGHDWSEWKVTKEATVEEAGIKERSCSVCGEKDTAVIPKLDPEKPVVVTEALKSEIEKAEAIKTEDYTDASVKTLNEALTAAKAAYEAAESQEAVDAAKEALAAAVMALEKKPESMPEEEPVTPPASSTPTAPATGDRAQIFAWIAAAFVMAAAALEANKKRKTE